MKPAARRLGLSILLLITVSLAGQDARTLAGQQFSFSYWNDNHQLQRPLAVLRPPGDDDLMTASFRLQHAGMRHGVWRANELYYAIFTDKQGGYRFDMLALRRSHEHKRGRLLLKYGYGLLIRGNFGGGELQNKYHAYMGYRLVELPYVSGYRAGILGLFRGAYRVVNHARLQITPYSMVNLRLGAGPTAARAGVEASFPWEIDYLKSQGSFDLRLGYVDYLWANDIIRPAFDKGLVRGIMWNLEVRRQLGLSLWFSENQYGHDDPYYGITLHFGTNHIKFGGFSSIMFP